MKYTRYCWLLLTACWLLAGAGLAQEPPTGLSDEVNDILEQISEDIDTFKLWNECAPIGLVVEELDDDAADIDLTEERVRTLAESRLRVARLYNAGATFSTPLLNVRVGVTVLENLRNGVFSIDVSFNKFLFDVVSDRGWFAPTWATVSYGAHGGDTDYILQSVSERIDWFILEYLRVNETACR